MRLSPHPAALNPGHSGGAGPLTASELQQLEATLLPALERHHLRLLAHGLRTLQQIAAESPCLPPGALPEQPAIAAWLLQQPALAGDPGFANTLSLQLRNSGEELQALALTGGRNSALDLELGDLIRWAQAAADARVLTPPPTAPPAEPAGPPAPLASQGDHPPNGPSPQP